MSIALAQGVSATAVDFMNRWRTVENAKGSELVSVNVRSLQRYPDHFS